MIRGYVLEKMRKKGRSSYLVELRDKKLVERFCYWYEVLKVRKEEVLRILSEEEFFISEQRVWTIIKDKKGVLSKESIENATRPKITAIRGVPTNVRVQNEYLYKLFPSKKEQ